ncbi:uncharacterized protein [Montipora foliosa]|uniref:uncharacterized protein isoform X2 n=1 Tax=Montipora foliosa TaxID=591990 RepID=UPI0035F136FD
MKPFGCKTFLKPSLLILMLVLSYAGATEKKAGTAFSRGETQTGVSYVNFKEDKFSYLKITILGYSHVDWMPQCSFACLETPTCFSYNLAAYPDINGKLLCELLPSDKYNNSDKFISNESFHHFSITSSCSGWPCKNNGTCLPLYEENSYKCVCKAGITGRDCENDIDECSSENECHVNATCTNTIGSYNCTCKNGYEGDGENCTDIDECSSKNECHVNAICANTIGSYNCTCKRGYGGDGRNCSDIDECLSHNECHLIANCTNTIGSYNCTCKKGYGGDGRNCTDIDECSSENECHVNAKCVNTIGSFNCTCKKGYEGDGGNCTDIDECSCENECHVNARCCNTIGSYNCICKKGYGGDGRNCAEKIEKSVIIGNNLTYLFNLSEWLKPVSQSNSSWILCWRASKHGWASSTFHSLCDGKGPTVTIIKVNQYIFGGYTRLSWDVNAILMKRDLSLPIRHGGLNIITPVTSASGEYHASQKISEPLKDMTVQQSELFSKPQPQPQSIKTHLRRQKQQETESAVQEIRESLSSPKQRMMDLLGEKGSSSWIKASI